MLVPRGRPGKAPGQHARGSLIPALPTQVGMPCYGVPETQRSVGVSESLARGDPDSSGLRWPSRTAQVHRPYHGWTFLISAFRPIHRPRIRERRSRRIRTRRSCSFYPGGEGQDENSPNNSRIEPLNHLLHYLAKTPGAVLPLLGGEGRGEDGRPTIFGFMGRIPEERLVRARGLHPGSNRPLVVRWQPVAPVPTDC
jgi:hypothetical protein